MNYDRPNDPNAGRLIESLRHLGYGNYEALADIVDNSIDAEARNINIRIFQREGHHEIWVGDDGNGMGRDTLDQAMKLGSETPRDKNSDLGKFGMGLVTASLSIARRCHVITVASDGVLSSAWDVDEIVEKNAFVKHLDDATADEAKMLFDGIGDKPSGTLIILSKIDSLTNWNTSSFATNLRNHLGRVHRHFLRSGLTITINGEEIPAIDPLELSDKATEIVIDENIIVSFTSDGEKQTEDVRVRIVLIPEEPLNERAIDKSMKAQGFYVLRNQREVMDANSLDFFTKHNDFNRMRGELFFPGTLDKVVGIEFTKRQVKFDQSIRDQLKVVIEPICKSLKARVGNERRAKTSAIQQELHARSAKVISEKDKLLIKPKARIEKRSSPTNVRDDRITEPSGTEKERRNLRRIQDVQSRLGCEIREERLGPNGQVYESDMEGRKIILRYNVEHPFYQRFIVDNLDEPRIVAAVDFLIYSLASAEWKMLDDGESEIINNFKAVFSANLRTLLN